MPPSSLICACSKIGVCYKRHQNCLNQLADLRTEHELPEQIPEESEDCLYLSIYVPAEHKPIRRSPCGSGHGDGKPVMFYIHGGALQSGTGNSFDGSSLAGNQDVVVVVINYRINGNMPPACRDDLVADSCVVFGFSNAPNLPLKSRNAAFWDQRMALSWVQDNIAAFGGDPRKVAIFGESSGASSVDRLLTTMIDNPPFRAAILQSGQASISAFPNDQGPAAWHSLVSALNCSSSDATAAAEKEFACVQAADARVIREIVNRQPIVPFSPVTDNVTQLATPLIEARRNGSTAQVPLMVGSNGQEGMNLGPSYHITDFDSVTEEILAQFLTNLTGSAQAGAAIMPIIKSIQKSSPWYNLFEAGAQLYTEVVYQCVRTCRSRDIRPKCC